MIRDAVEGDSEAIAHIYNHYIENTAISFEEKPVLGSDIQGRIENVQGAGLPWLVAVEEGDVVGYAYATKWKERSAYRFSVKSASTFPIRRTVGAWAQSCTKRSFPRSQSAVFMR